MVYGITWGVLHINSGSSEAQIGPQDASKFQTVVWTGLSIGFVASILFHYFIKEGNGYVGNNVRGGDLRLPISELLCNVEVYQVICLFYICFKY